MPDGVDATADKGKQIIARAFNEEYCVLEFNEMDDGTMRVADVTEHFRQLERMHADNDPAEPLDQ